VYCRKCGKQGQDGSKFCGFCGAEFITTTEESISPVRITARTVENITPTSITTKPAGNKKRWIIPLIVLVVIFIVFASYVVVNYFLATAAMHDQRFIKAKHYYDNLLISDRLFSDQYEYVEAGVLMEEGKYIQSLNAFNKIENIPIPADVLDHVKSEIYHEGQEAYSDHRWDDAKSLFNTINGFEHSNDYLLLIYCKNDVLEDQDDAQKKYDRLIEIIDFEDTKDVIMKNESTASLFLTGYWKNGDDGFDMLDDNGSTITYNLPHKDINDYYSISDGILSFGTTEMFKFSIVDIDTVSVYCYSDGSTIELYRSKESALDYGYDNYIGVYKLSGAMGFSLEEFSSMVGMTEEETADMVQVELKDNGVLELTFDGETEAGTWQVSGDTITLEEEGETIFGTIKDGVITIEIEGETMTLTREE